MDLSIFLAKFFGIYLLVFAFVWASRRVQVSTSIDQIFTNRGSLALAGIISLLVGVAIVVSHSIWELNWRGMITLFGYISILKGISRLGYPEQAARYSLQMLKGNQFGFLLALTVLLGVYLTYSGYSS